MKLGLIGEDVWVVKGVGGYREMRKEMASWLVD